MVRYCVYSLEDSKTNPQKMWLNVGQPLVNVTPWQIKKIRQASKLHQSDITTPIHSTEWEKFSICVLIFRNFVALLIWNDSKYLPYFRYYKTVLYLFLRPFGASSIQMGLVFEWVLYLTSRHVDTKFAVFESKTTYL